MNNERTSSSLQDADRATMGVSGYSPEAMSSRMRRAASWPSQMGLYVRKRREKCALSRAREKETAAGLGLLPVRFSGKRCRKSGSSRVQNRSPWWVARNS